MSELTHTSEARTGKEAKLSRRLLKALGRKSLEFAVGERDPRTPLAEGYRYEIPNLLGSTEVGKLMQTTETYKDVPDRYVKQRNDWLQDEDHKIVDVAVAESAGGTLVGYGSILYSGTEGLMGDFVVSSEHRSKGIGKAIVRERLRIADDLGLTTLRIPNVKDGNTLHNATNANGSFYEELGFKPDDMGHLVRHTGLTPDHFQGTPDQLIEDLTKAAVQ